MGVAISDGMRLDSEKKEDAQKKLNTNDNAAIAMVACLFPLLKAKPPAATSIANKTPMPMNAVGRRPARSMTKGATIVPANVQQDAMIVRVNAFPMPISVKKTVVYVVDRITPETWLREKNDPAVMVRLRCCR